MRVTDFAAVNVKLFPEGFAAVTSPCTLEAELLIAAASVLALEKVPLAALAPEATRRNVAVWLPSFTVNVSPVCAVVAVVRLERSVLFPAVAV